MKRTDCWSKITRVLLTYAQVHAYALPATEGKQGDPRWPAFAARYDFDPARPVQCEVEALEPEELQRLVLTAVDPYVDREVLAEQMVREEEQRRTLVDYLGVWGPRAVCPAATSPASSRSTVRWTAHWRRRPRSSSATSSTARARQCRPYEAAVLSCWLGAAAAPKTDAPRGS